MKYKPYAELKQQLNHIPNTKERILLKLIYVGCARVGEIVRHRYKPKLNPPLQRNNIDITPNFLYLNIKTEKRNVDRTVTISRLDNPSHEFYKKSEAWLTEEIITYAKHNPILFDYSVRWAQKKFKKYFPDNHIHELRKWRATHLLSGEATGVPLPERLVAKHGGWFGTATLTKFYDGTNVSSYVGVDEAAKRKNLGGFVSEV